MSTSAIPLGIGSYFFPALLSLLEGWRGIQLALALPSSVWSTSWRFRSLSFGFFFFPSAHIKNELVICGLYPLGFSLNKMLENINSFGEELSPAKAVLFFRHDFKALWTRINMRLGTLLLACSWRHPSARTKLRVLTWLLWQLWLFCGKYKDFLIYDTHFYHLPPSVTLLPWTSIS